MPRMLLWNPVPWERLLSSSKVKVGPARFSCSRAFTPAVAIRAPPFSDHRTSLRLPGAVVRLLPGVLVPASRTERSAALPHPLQENLYLRLGCYIFPASLR